ncbi:MAG: SDR family oxidoreductase [Pseudomonadota bacterium]
MPESTDRTLLSIGHGYSARELSKHLLAQDWRVIGTTRSADKTEEIRASGAEPVIWPDADLSPLFAEATHLLLSAGPEEDGDPVLKQLDGKIPANDIVWAGYLSTTGVYGNRDGGWVDETSDCNPATKRGQWRLDAERTWAETGLPLHIFRLAGIYGPGRGPFAKVRNGTARRIIKENQIFSRTHVEDIARILHASIEHPNSGAIYNVCDNYPAPPEDVIAHAAELLGLPLPEAVRFEDADMSPMARSFYAESKRVSNRRVREELGVEMLYPSYREGLAALLRSETQGV